MAYVEKPAASLVYVLQDETGDTSNFSLDVPVDTLADVALTGAAALRPLIEACTDCTVLSYSLTYTSSDTNPPPAAPGSRVERKGVFQFYTDVGKTVTYQLPGIIEAAVLPSGRVDEDNPAISALTVAMLALDALFCDSNGRKLSSLKAAYERYSSTTKKQLPRERRPD